MPAHHEIEETIDEYLSKVSIEGGQPLFQSVNKAGTALTGWALNRHYAWAAIRKRARNVGFLTPVGCHTWRATGVTVYLENGGRLEHALQMLRMSRPGPPNFTTEPKTRSQSVRSSEFNFKGSAEISFRRINTFEYLITSCLRYVFRMKTPRYRVFRSKISAIPVFSTNWKFLAQCYAKYFCKNYGRVEKLVGDRYETVLEWGYGIRPGYN